MGLSRVEIGVTRFSYKARHECAKTKKSPGEFCRVIWVGVLRQISRVAYFSMGIPDRQAVDSFPCGA